ncbi:hypothetical protein ACJJTC_002072 [Scirpophaga incertulas]
MDESEQLPLKRVELSLSKFNEVAIPHHLDLLRQHKLNIIKHTAAGQWRGVRAEQARAARVAGRLRALLAELAALRARVRPRDQPRFDAATERARAATLRAVQDYLGIIENGCKTIVTESRATLYTREETSPMAVPAGGGDERERDVAGSAVSTDSVGVVHHADDDQFRELQLQVDEQEAALREREAVLVGWGQLQAEVRALHGAWQAVQAAVLAQRDLVASTAAHVDTADVNVAEGKKSLALAERARAGAWAVGGAALGALVGGPVGLVAGAKAGAAAALAGSASALLALRLWPRPANPPPADTPPADPPPAERDRDRDPHPKQQ